jgi:CHAD domain-containing protein
VNRTGASQFIVPDGVEAGGLVARLREHLPWSLREESAHDLQLTLLDTFDWRVFEGGGWLELETAGRTHRLTWRSADELEVRESTPVAALPRFAGDLPPGRLRDALAPLLDVRALLPLARLSGRTTTLDATDPEGKTVLRLGVEALRLRRPGHRPGPWMRRLRLLPVRGYGEAAAAAESLARDTLGLPPAEGPLRAEALMRGGHTPADYDPSLSFQLAPEERTDGALQRILHKLLDTMLANEPGVREQIDTEFLHDLRVAVRRARSLLGQVRGVFPERLVQGLRDDLGWIGRSTNAARDMDVYLLAFDDYAASLPPPVHPHLGPFRAFLTAHQARAYGEVAACFDSARFHRLVERWRSLSGRPLPRRPVAKRALRPVGQVARKRIWRAYRTLMRLGGAIHLDSPAGDLHEVRIAGKKLRYLLEFFRSLFPAETVGTLVRALKTFQDNLGEMQDLHVQQEQLGRFERQMAKEGALSPETAGAMELLIEGLARRQTEVRLEFADRFEAFSAPETVRAFRQTFRERKADKGKETP